MVYSNSADVRIVRPFSLSYNAFTHLRNVTDYVSRFFNSCATYTIIQFNRNQIYFSIKMVFKIEHIENEMLGLLERIYCLKTN